MLVTKYEGASIAARPAHSMDDAILRRLFEESANPLPTIAPEQAAFLNEVQFLGRCQSYAARFPDAEDVILCQPDGTSIGRCLYVRLPDCLRIIDLAVLATYQKLGVGTNAIRMLQNFAKDAHRPLRLRVVKGNPAIRLYERLGFHITKSDQIASEMEWLHLNAVQAMYLQASVPHGSI